ncbi:hypothetical protein HPB52_007967 [Rhipicephalus sanguineus]|uniref:Uncharacterized protein n=1 Tax=Rhipicephalus sanguineus TaxID=34632 RepID=A0A9D4T1T3_RHISA|nr:hypothetical protein HPB52_007967 [Rhipicephalus sanguineus]
MNSVMEDVSSTFALDPQEEMRLLKDKVRQLELQNKQLRRSQQHLRSLSPCKTADSEKNSKDLKQSFNMSMSDEGNEKSSKESSLEDLGLIDVEFMSELDDETWLYEPPETGAGEATAALTSSARERVTAEPREPVNSARLSLSDKLDEITQWPSRTFDSRTFTRPRRRRPALDLEAMPTIAAVEAGSPRELPVRPAVQPASSPGVVSPSKEEASPSSPVPPVVPAQTLPRAPVNVHEIARLQEENCRPLRIAHVGTHPLILRGCGRPNTTVGAFLSQDVPNGEALSGLATEGVSRVSPISYATTCKVHACTSSSSTGGTNGRCGNFRSTEVGAAATFPDSTTTFAEEVSAVQELLPLCLRM